MKRPIDKNHATKWLVGFSIVFVIFAIVFFVQELFVGGIVLLLGGLLLLIPKFKDMYNKKKSYKLNNDIKKKLEDIAEQEIKQSHVAKED